MNCVDGGEGLTPGETGGWGRLEGGHNDRRLGGLSLMLEGGHTDRRLGGLSLMLFET